MPKLPVFTSKQIIKVLKKKGFELDHITGSHYIFYHPVHKQRVIVPHHVKDLPKGTVISILKQAGFDREEMI